MDVSLASDCTQATITSTLIDDFIDNYPNGDDLSLTIEYQCGTGTTIELDNTTIDFGNYNYVLLPETLSQSETLCDGIYFFTMTSTDDNGSETNEYYCLFVDCKVKCLLIPYMAENITSNISGLYDRLKDITLCSDPECKCDNGCILYERIVDLLNGVTAISQSKTLDCGCK